MTRTKHLIKDTAEYVAVLCAAIIGAILMLTVIAAITHHPAATPQAARPAATHLVVCDLYLSRQAMILNQIDHVGPLPTPSLCTVAN